MINLYFPQCRVARLEQVPDGLGIKANFYIKSLTNSPKHYPESPLIKGKADFIFIFHNKSITQKIVDNEKLRSIFGENAIKNDNTLVKSFFIGTKVSVLAQFNAEANIKLKCLAIGPVNDLPNYFLQGEDDYNEKLALSAKLHHDLYAKAKKAKVFKI